MSTRREDKTGRFEEDFAAERPAAYGKGHLRRSAVSSPRAGHTGEDPCDCHRP